MTEIRTFLGFAVLGCSLLTACSGAPSEGDIQGAVDRQMQKDQAAMAQFGGGALAKSFLPEVKGVKKIGCKEDGEKAYRCDVELAISQNGKTSNGATEVRLVKLSDGWSIGR